MFVETTHAARTKLQRSGISTAVVVMYSGSGEVSNVNYD
jgi:hypothetical protein